MTGKLERQTAENTNVLKATTDRRPTRTHTIPLARSALFLGLVTAHNSEQLKHHPTGSILW